MAKNKGKKTGIVTSYAVAELAGVSRSAVSRAFSGGKVSASTREKVFKAAAQLGYEENRLAKGLIEGKSGIVCIVAEQVETPWHAKLTNALVDEIQASGRVALIITSASGDAEEALRKTIQFRAEASIVLSGSPPRSIAEACVRFGQRLVLIDRDEGLENSLSICPNNVAAAQRVCGLLKSLDIGSFAFLMSRSQTQGIQARLKAVQEEARSANLDLTVLELGETNYEGGKVLASELLSQRKYPRTVFCATDLLACGLIDAAKYIFGMRVPDDLNVIGFDDIPQASWSSYGLTTFSQPVNEMAQAAISFIDKRNDSKAMFIEPQLVLRNSVALRSQHSESSLGNPP